MNCVISASYHLLASFKMHLWSTKKESCRSDIINTLSIINQTAKFVSQTDALTHFFSQINFMVWPFQLSWLGGVRVRSFFLCLCGPKLTKLWLDLDNLTDNCQHTFCIHISPFTVALFTCLSISRSLVLSCLQVVISHKCKTQIKL